MTLFLSISQFRKDDICTKLICLESDVSESENGFNDDDSDMDSSDESDMSMR